MELKFTQTYKGLELKQLLELYILERNAREESPDKSSNKK